MSTLPFSTRIEREYSELPPGPERRDFICKSDNAEIIWAERARFFHPRDANTLAAALTTDYLADGLIIAARNKLAPLAAFSRKVSVDRLKPRATVQVPRATVGATGVSDASNFQPTGATADSTLANIAVAVSQRTVTFHLTNDQLNKGFELAHLSQINADQFADLLSDVYTALFTSGNFGTQTIGIAGSFDQDDLPAILDTAVNFRQRNLLLDGRYYGRLFKGAVPGFHGGFGSGQTAFGFDSISVQNRFTGSATNSVGFACGPDAVAVAAGLPLFQRHGFLAQSTVNIDLAGSQPGQGLPIEISIWFDLQTRTTWGSYEVMFGAAVGDATQGKCLVSA